MQITNSQAAVDSAFDYCENVARSHYENFPVASFFLPRTQRRELAAIYAFARAADDFADEGTLSAAERLRHLDAWGRKLDDCFLGNPDGPVFTALAETVARAAIPKRPLADLLVAFRMDVTRNRFATFAEVLHYCKHSADPVGRLVLHVFGGATDRLLSLSDKVCTGLQLANFWQDISRDALHGRVNLPLEDLDRFGYTEKELSREVANEQFRNLLRFEVGRTRGFFEAGKPLLAEAPSALKFELALTWHGGECVLRKIEDAGYDVLSERPFISFSDKVKIFLRSIMRRMK